MNRRQVRQQSQMVKDWFNNMNAAKWFKKYGNDPVFSMLFYRDGRWAESHMVFFELLPGNVLAGVLGLQSSEQWGFHTITELRSWNTLNVFPRGNKYHTKDDENQMRRILEKIHEDSIIDFYAAGTIWRIEVNS